MKDNHSGFSVAALVLGIIAISLFGTCCFSFLSIFPAIAGLICALIARNKTYKWEGTAIAGFVCSIVTIVLFCLLMATGLYGNTLNYSDPSSIFEDNDSNDNNESDDVVWIDTESFSIKT